MYNIAIRADGHPSIGMGHIMRCLSLAKEFRKIGCTIYFFSKYSEGISEISLAGFTTIQIRSNLDCETQEIRNLLSSYSIDLLIIDTYHVNAAYFSEIKPFVRELAYIDDLNMFSYEVDILINGNITGDSIEYKKNSNIKMLLTGSKYNLIRDEFRDMPLRKINKKIKDIMLTTGGSDPYDLSITFANWIFSNAVLKDIRINIVVGNMYKNKNRLRDLTNHQKNIILHEKVRTMSEIMLKSDIAISAGGSTLYELCACGTPTFAFIMASNQELLVKKMQELNYVESLGWYDKLTKESFIDNLMNLVNDHSTRKIISNHMQKLVDGEGAARVVKEIMSLLSC